MQTLNQKELGHALFYSLKKGDLDHAQYLLSIDAPTNTSYFLSQDRISYTQNLMAGTVARVIKQYGASHGRSLQALGIFNSFCKNKADLRCHCIAKHPHYCSMGEALRYLSITFPEDLQVQENFIMLVKLLFNGATYNNLNNSKEYIWTAIKEVQAFIETRGDLASLINQSNRRCKGEKDVRPQTCHKLRK